MTTLRRSIVLIPLILLAACGTPTFKETQQFGAAASLLADASAAGFEQVNRWSVERKLYDLAADPTLGPTDADLRGFFERDGGDASPEQRLALRLNVLRGLSEYAKALETLAMTDVTVEVNEAATGLNGALGSLNLTYAAARGGQSIVSDEQLEVISGAVALIGRGISENKRRTAIAQILESSNSAIQAVASLIADELGPDSELASYAIQSVSNTRGSLQTGYNFGRTDPGSTFDARLATLRDIRSLYIAERELASYFTAVSAGARQLAEAHAKLLAATKGRSVEDLYKAISELAGYGQEVQRLVNKFQG